MFQLKDLNKLFGWKTSETDLVWIPDSWIKTLDGFISFLYKSSVVSHGYPPVAVLTALLLNFRKGCLKAFAFEILETFDKTCRCKKFSHVSWHAAGVF